MAEKKEPERKMAMAIKSTVRKRIRHYLAEHEGIRIKDLFNEALDEYLKKRGA